MARGQQSEKIRRAVINEEVLLLDWLFSFLSDKSKSTVRSILKEGQVEVNGHPTRQFDTPLHVGDKIEIGMVRGLSRTPYKGVEIIYEDDDLMIIDKASGLNSIAVRKDPRIKNVYHILDEYLKRVDSPYSRIYVVHRLDRDTSGLMIFAKTSRAQTILRHNWNDMVVDRKYVAVVEGLPTQQNGRIESFLMEDKATMSMYSTNDPNGKLAVTHYHLLQASKHYSLLELDLESGRKNQIRVHMSDIKHPVTGDLKYGAAHNPINRMALHAYKLSFIHPITRKILKFETDIPSSFLAITRDEQHAQEKK